MDARPLASVVLFVLVACGGSTTSDNTLFSSSTGGAASTGGTSGGAGTGGDGPAGAGGDAAGAGGMTSAGGSTATGAGGAGAKGGSTGPGGASGAGGGNSMACNECVAKACPVALADCGNDPQCATCAQPGGSLACFANTHLDKLLACACQACDAKCPSVDCAAVPCLQCSAKNCAKEISACEGDPTCPSCLQKNPPDACKSNPAAVGLYTCDAKHCAGPCGL